MELAMLWGKCMPCSFSSPQPLRLSKAQDPVWHQRLRGVAEGNVGPLSPPESFKIVFDFFLRFECNIPLKCSCWGFFFNVFVCFYFAFSCLLLSELVRCVVYH
ncbi:hypothetical protein H1C71_035931 [Ictidomys tridecemlineatus]|nr:hypothetical protein H1C71_035931 [Ictidomys tridecemlineatus]